MRYPLPKDTGAVLEKGIRQNRNLGLALDKFLPCEDEKWDITRDGKQRKAAPLNMSQINDLLKGYRLRWEAARKSFSVQGYHVAELTSARVDYRLVVGFGAEHVLETNLCLHRIYGFPIIPGSAVKGVTRAWAFWEIAEELGVPAASAEEAEHRAKAKPKRPTPLQLLDHLLSAVEAKEQQAILERLQKDELCESNTAVQSLNFSQWQARASDFYAVFGTTERQGRVIFFDAYPTQAPKMKLDILNPHYAQYYSDREKRTPPADYHNPVPNYFLTVDKGSAFQFAVASKDEALARKAQGWLKQALTELGIGGKTAAGYGFMEMK